MPDWQFTYSRLQKGRDCFSVVEIELLKLGRQNMITGSLAGSPNLLLSNGVDGQVKRRSVTGSAAAWAKSLVDNDLKTRWVVSSDHSPLRF